MPKAPDAIAAADILITYTTNARIVTIADSCRSVNP